MKLKFKERLKQGFEHRFPKTAAAFRKWKEQRDEDKLEDTVNLLWFRSKGKPTTIKAEVKFSSKVNCELSTALANPHTHDRAAAEIKKALDAKWPDLDAVDFNRRALDALHHAIICGIDIRQFVPRVMELLLDSNWEVGFKARVALFSLSGYGPNQQRPMERISEDHLFLALEIARFMKSPEMVGLAEDNRPGYPNLIKTFADAMRNIEDAGTLNRKEATGSL